MIALNFFPLCKKLIKVLIEYQKNYQDTVMYFDPITRQTINYTTPESYDYNTQKIMALGTDNYEKYLLTPKPVLRGTSTLFEPKQFEPLKSPKAFTAQKSGSKSNCEFKNSRIVICLQNIPILH